MLLWVSGISVLIGFPVNDVMDETPLLFEFLDGQSYTNKGSKTVQVKTTHSGWDKRQATIMLCVFADGAMHVPP